MAIESVDLMKLLNRARKVTPEPVAQPATETSDPVANAMAALAEAQAEVRLPAAEPPVASSPQESTTSDRDLANLRAELESDETLLRRILGMLYRSKKENPNGGAISILVMEKVLGLEREGAAFVMMYMKSKKVIEMDDKSRLSITVSGIDYLRGVFALRGDGPAGDGEADPED